MHTFFIAKRLIPAALIIGLAAAATHHPAAAAFSLCGPGSTVAHRRESGTPANCMTVSARSALPLPFRFGPCRATFGLRRAG